MKAILFCVGSFVGALFSFPVGFASTPDGETPAEEHVCDGYRGAAFGLCNAYCEAMDCDDDPNADQDACDKVEDKFEARTGKDIPCGGATCGDFVIDDMTLGEVTGSLEGCRQVFDPASLTCQGPDNSVWVCDALKDRCYFANCYAK